MKSILQKLKGVLSKNVSIADYRKYLSDKYGKFDEEDYLEERARPASKTKFQKAMAKVVKVLPPDYDRLLPSIVRTKTHHKQDWGESQSCL